MSPFLIKIAILAFIGAALSTSFAPAPKWKPKEFPVSFWCGPPEKYATPERFKEIAEAGFNYTFPSCEGPFTTEGNLRILDGARSAGIKAFIYDDRIPLSISGIPDATQRLDAIITTYSRRPAFAGYFIVDEPSVDKFEGLAEVVEYLLTRDPKHPAYINLWPNNAGAKRMGIDGYGEYLKRFVSTVKPAFLSYDHYHWTKTGDRPGFISNLQTVSDLACQHELDFWHIILSLKHMEYKEPTEAEMRYDAMHTLAFGGKGLMYFTYWTPPGMDFSEGEGFIDRNGKRTVRFEEVKRINADVKAIGNFLLNAKREMTYQSGSEEPGVQTQPPDAPVRIEKGNVTAGLFRSGSVHYVLLANRSAFKAERVQFSIRSPGPVKVLSRHDSKWVNCRMRRVAGGDGQVGVELAPGGAELFRW